MNNNEQPQIPEAENPEKNENLTDIPMMGDAVKKLRKSKSDKMDIPDGEDSSLNKKPVNTDVKTEMQSKENDGINPVEDKSADKQSSSPESLEMFAIINWYQRNCSKFEPYHLKQIMEKRGKLAAFSVKYAQVVLKYGKQYAQYHVDRQVNVKSRSNELQAQIDPTASNGKTYTNARANEIATVENKDVYKAEYLAEANYNGHKLILNQINAVLDAMRQDIAELRSIRNDNDKTEGDID